MIGPANETIGLSRIKVLTKRVVLMVAALSSFHEDETDRKLSSPMLRQARPVNMPLIMRHVHAMYFEIARHAHAITLQPVARLPAISIGTDEKPVETCREDHDDAKSQHIAYPYGHSALLCLPFGLGRLSMRSSRAASYRLFCIVGVLLFSGNRRFSHTSRSNRVQS